MKPGTKRHPIRAMGLGFILILPGMAQALSGIPDEAIAKLWNAKNWKGLVDYYDHLPAPAQEAHRADRLEALYRSGEWKRVLELSEDICRRGTRNEIPRARTLKGRALSQSGLHAQALECFREGAKAGNLLDNLEGCNEAVALADWKAMEAFAEALLVKNPTNGTYLVLKGEALSNQGRFKEAGEVLDEGVHLAPKNPMAWADLACCRNEGQDYPGAFEAASRAVALDPKCMEGWYNRGRASVGLKHVAEGREDFAKALALNPQDPVLVRNLKLNIDMADKFLAYARSRERKGAPVRK